MVYKKEKLNTLPFSHSILTDFDQRFFPSEFGMDVDKNHAVEPAKSTFAIKAQIRRAVEAEGIPYTYVPANCFAGYFLPTLSQPGATSPPRDKVVILGDGNPKGKQSISNQKLDDRLVLEIKQSICHHHLQLFSTMKLTSEPTSSKLSMTPEH